MADWTTADIPDQHGRTVLITGANSGLGLASAEALAAKGARVLLACRNPAKGADALATVAAVATGEAPVLVALDLADLGSVAAAAEATSGLTDHLDLLLNNAGIMAVPQARTVDGFESQFGTNHLGHFALTGRLLPLLLAADAPRVVTTASNAHKFGRMHFDDLDLDHRYGKWKAYGQSKLSNLLFAFELDRKAKAAGSNLLSVAAHPGYARTHLTTAGVELTGQRLMGRAMALGDRLLAQPAAAGALPQLRAATSPTVHGGQYYGPANRVEQQGPPTLVRARPAAYDETAAARLWTVSEERTGVSYPWA